MRALLVLLVLAGDARAQVTVCHVVDVKLTPARRTPPPRFEPPQIVVWLEKPDGTYVDTLYITQETGRYGLGNRPGRFDFNAGPMWPYGRRVTTFPVWAHRKLPQSYPQVIFQNVEGVSQQCVSDCTSSGGTQSECEAKCANPTDCENLVNDPSNTANPMAFASCGDNDLSHPFMQSSRELRFCQPLMESDPLWMDADAMTCATSAFTDKGKFSTTRTSEYPPRIDLVRTSPDSPSIDMYKLLNTFDAVSQATPPPGTQAHVVWPTPQDFAPGDYVMWVEVSEAFDYNASYDDSSYPSPPGTGSKAIFYYQYGLPYRGQPSVVYRVPFTVSDTTATTAFTAVYAGYGDPEGKDGNLRPPDATISTGTPGSGEGRLQLVSEAGTMYRVLVGSRAEIDYAPPGAPERLEPATVGPTSVTLRFIAPGDDGLIGKVVGYEVRYLADRELTADAFDTGTIAAAALTPVDPGGVQTIDLAGLLPETDYWIGVRAYDDCHNNGAVSIVKVTTANRTAGAVDACFVATAAYGSRMASDVELLRHVRDTLLEKTVIGELATQAYYTFGPAVAGVVGESELLRASARAVLQPIIARVRGLAY